MKQYVTIVFFNHWYLYNFEKFDNYFFNDINFYKLFLMVKSYAKNYSKLKNATIKDVLIQI